MNYADLLQALSVSEITEWDIETDKVPTTSKSVNQRLREKHPGIKQSYDEYIEAKHKYKMLLKLVKVLKLRISFNGYN